MSFQLSSAHPMGKSVSRTQLVGRDGLLHRTAKLSSEHPVARSPTHHYLLCELLHAQLQTIAVGQDSDVYPCLRP